MGELLAEAHKLICGGTGRICYMLIKRKISKKVLVSVIDDIDIGLKKLKEALGDEPE